MEITPINAHPGHAQYSPHGLKHEAEVVLVEEVSVESDHMKLIIRISFVQFLKDL